MLKIIVVNDGTANTAENTAHPPTEEAFVIVGNYNYRVFINDELVGSGRVENHNRLTGWQGLLSCLDKEINGDRFRE